MEQAHPEENTTERIWRALEAERLTTARELLEVQCRAAPDAPIWEFLRCDVLRQMGLTREAELGLLAVRPRSGTFVSRVDVSLGKACEDDGRPVEAEAWFRRAVEGDPGSGAPRIQLGGFLARRGRFADAISSYESALGRGNCDDEALLNIGMCWRALREYGKALSAVTRALAITPDYELAKELHDDIRQAMGIS
jgi:tetratricopeptide (TPR) repeat protein